MGEYSKGKATRNYALAVYKSGALRSVNNRVDNVSFKENQELQFEEETQQFGEEVKWTSPLHIPIYPNNSILIHFTLLLFCINLKGTPIKDLPSLLLMKP